MNKKLIWGLIIAVIVIVLVVVGVGGSNSNSDKGVIKIGQVSALSGAGADIGEEERNGAILAIEKINQKGGIDGRELQLVSEDISLDKLKETGSVFRKLVDIDNVVAIVGPQWDEPGAIFASLSKELSIPVISPNVSPQVENGVNSEYFFSNFYSNKVGIDVLLQFAKDQGYQKIAIVQPASFGFWEYTSRLFRENAPKYGIEIVTEEYGTDFANTDYKTLIAKTKTHSPDAVFGSYADLECLFIQQMKNQNLNVPLLSTESAGTPKALEGCPDLLVGNLFFSTPLKNESYEEFETDYIEKFGNKPLSPSAVTSYDAVFVVADAIDKTNSLDSDKIVDYLSKNSYENGASLPLIKFDEMGFVITPESAFEIKKVESGQFVSF